MLVREGVARVNADLGGAKRRTCLSSRSRIWSKREGEDGEEEEETLLVKGWEGAEGVCKWKCSSSAASHPGEVKRWRTRKLLVSCRVAGIVIGDSVRRRRLCEVNFVIPCECD
jgi:hypothetical protein